MKFCLKSHQHEKAYFGGFLKDGTVLCVIRQRDAIKFTHRVHADLLSCALEMGVVRLRPKNPWKAGEVRETGIALAELMRPENQAPSDTSPITPGEKGTEG